MQVSQIIVLVMVMILCIILQEPLDAFKGSKMRRKKVRKENAARFFFIQNQARKEYYNNSNAAEIVRSSYFDIEYELGDKIEIVCMAKGEPAPRVFWFKDGAELITHQFSRIYEWQINSTFIKSKVEIDPARQTDAGTYECQANNMYSIDRRVFKADF